jgi:hypothetical protein
MLFRKVLRNIEGKADDVNRFMREAIDKRIDEFSQLEQWVKSEFDDFFDACDDDDEGPW